MDLFEKIPTFIQLTKQDQRPALDTEVKFMKLLDADPQRIPEIFGKWHKIQL